jgi:hypothetical protein
MFSGSLFIAHSFIEYSTILSSNFFINILKNLASKDAYFGLFATVVGSFIGYAFARRSEIVEAQHRIVQLKLEIHYYLVLIERDRLECLPDRELSKCRDKLKSLYDSIVQLYAQFVISNRKYEGEMLQPFINAIMSLLLRAVDGYEFRDSDIRLLDEIAFFLNLFCRNNKNFLARKFNIMFKINFIHDQQEFLHKYLEKYGHMFSV